MKPRTVRGPNGTVTQAPGVASAASASGTRQVKASWPGTSTAISASSGRSGTLGKVAARQRLRALPGRETAAMRSADARQSSLFTMIQTEDRIPAKHPLRAIRAASAEAITGMRWQIEKLYDPEAKTKTAIAPEEALRSLLLLGLYGIPSERRLIEELEYNLLYRWFVGLQLDDAVFERETFRQHRAKLTKAGILGEFVRRTLSGTRIAVLKNPHFLPNKPLLEAWAGQLRWDR